MTTITGGNSSPMNADNEIQRITYLMQPVIESRLNKSFTTFQATTYTQQIVAGNVYHVRIVTDDDILHVRIYQPLPHTQKGPEVQTIKISNEEDMLHVLQPDDTAGRSRFMTA